MPAATAPVGLATVVAAWPTGASQLAIAFDACQRGEMASEWLARATKSIALRSAF
jgi:hypothetical protein